MNNNKLIFTIFFTLCFNCLFSQVNIDSLVKSQPLAKIDQINRARCLLWDEVRSQNDDIEFITNIQNYLNNFTDTTHKVLDNDENFFLYIYTQQWDSVLNIISKMNYPYQIHQLSFVGEDIFIQREINTTVLFLVKKSKFINHHLYSELSNSNLPTEQKDFLNVFIPKYFGYKTTQNNTKIKSAYQNFKKKYPASQYLKYINDEK